MMIFKLALLKAITLFNSIKTGRLANMIDFYLQLKHLTISQWDVETKELNLPRAGLRQQIH
ncbi:hypothetical protein [Thalassomonas actiniarum]|uniref:Uncharacterized protein n=1 Tax=Thalassomonas actiniarum TaxID=485447 RepID=A0AAE9YU03_9GAMM|nr:hypothetical protein [Thalassomonas actiniarum]WDE00260.1 hypothetical protein SG35_006300 [Thalassomonas actiniarum]